MRGAPSARVRASFLLVLLAAPLASAHGAFDGGAPLGEASVHLQLAGAPLLAVGVPYELRARTDAQAPLEARLVTPDASARPWFALVPQAGVQARQVTFDQAGAWRLEVRAGAHAATFDLDVWPAARAFVEPAHESGVLVAGRAQPVALRLVDAAHRPLAPPEDAQARLVGPHGESTHALEAHGGLLVLERAWREPGAYALHVSTASAGIAPGAAPPLAFLVVDETDAAVYGLARETPGPSWALVGLAALAALLLARLTRARS